MKNTKWFSFLFLMFFCISGSVFAQEQMMNNPLTAMVNVQKYERAIHIMAMLLLGFGFLMVFVKKYGRSALTATFLLVSVTLPLYLVIGNYSMFCGGKVEIEKMILAEFAAASLLITAGALLGRLKMPQYIILGLLFVPCYMLNEWVVTAGGFGLIPAGGVADTGGSIIIHAFGAIFGVFASMAFTRKQELDIQIETDASSDRFSLLGSMVLWVFWPSFCGALVTPEQIPQTVINVILALCGSTLATYALTMLIRRKISAADIANAALAGGVAIGSTCDHASPGAAIAIGVLAGALSTFGFAVLQSKQAKIMQLVDTCGVTNLHGLPGLLGGLAAIPLVKGLVAYNQLMGILITIVIAVVGGFLVGKILMIFGRNKHPYDDASEFLDVEG